MRLLFTAALLIGGIAILGFIFQITIMAIWGLVSIPRSAIMYFVKKKKQKEMELKQARFAAAMKRMIEDQKREAEIKANQEKAYRSGEEKRSRAKRTKK